ncbi:MAG: hypothetical protein CK424_02540 [Legionella sp.]|nr:MAG: hypothetical protein CK424_02540 [Legionella sp.]
MKKTTLAIATLLTALSTAVITPVYAEDTMTPDQNTAAPSSSCSGCSGCNNSNSGETPTDATSQGTGSDS